MNKNLTDIPGFFTNRLEGQTFYRPLSRETYNLIMYKLFSLNPMPFHLVNLSLILTNTVLLVLITKKLTNNLLTVFLSAFIFLVSSVHSIELYYLSSVQTLLSTSVVLLSIFFYVLYINARLLNYFLASILLFSIALLCHESAIIFPVFILLVDLFFGKKTRIKSVAGHLTPFFLLALIFFISTSPITALPSQKVYQPVFNLKSSLNTLGWYGAWSLGLPEMLVDFIGPNLKLKREFIIWYKDYSKIVFPLVFFICSIQLLFILYFIRSFSKNKFLIFSILAFVTSLLPFLFFPQHKFVYYLSLALVWFSIISGFILSRAWRYTIIHKVLVILVILSATIVSNRTIEINSVTYWAAKRAIASKDIMDGLKRSIPQVPENAIFYFVDDPSYPNIVKEWGTSSKQAFYILSGSDALKLLYNKSSIRAYYESNGGLPDNVDKSNVITIMAKFPY